MNLDLNNIFNIKKEDFNRLSNEEKNIVLTILKEMKELGNSPTLDSIWKQDYEEIPVDIDTFIESDLYLGKSTRNGKSIWPFWREQYRQIFAEDNYKPQVVFTGAIGIGKTKTAVVCLCYMLYRLMCLKNPQEYYGFNEGEVISILFFNITLTLAEGVAYKAMQEFLQASPWFMERGVVTGLKNKIYNPPKKIALTFGSKPEHALGQQVYCLTGNTPVHTTKGIFNLEDLEGHKFQVLTLNPLTNLIEVSKPTTCIQTTTVTRLIKITLEDNTVIEGTGEHRLCVGPDKYLALNKLAVGGQILTVPDLGIEEAPKYIKIKSIEWITVPETPVYDIVNVKFYHNFAIPTNTSGVNIISHNCAILDEIDFAKGQNVLMDQSKIMETYRAVYTRITSRFMRNGKILGKLFLVSSKKSEYDFLESFIRRMQKDEEESKRLHIVDEPLWVVKPSTTYTGEKFYVAVGNKLLPSQVVPKNATQEYLDGLVQQGYELMQVPIEHRGEFVSDINRSLMDLAGRSVMGTTSFFNYELFSKCYVDFKNPFKNDILTIGINDPLNIADFFLPDNVEYKLRRMPIYVHIDTSLTGDKTGISAVGVSGKKISKMYMGGQEMDIEEIMYKHLFTVYIQAPHGTEISLEKNRQFVYYLSQIGFNIRGVSLDGFQSADTRQILESKGYNAVIRSLDKTPDGYLVTRSAMNDGRIGLIRIEKLETELVQLQRDNISGKLDHPIDGCFTIDTQISLVDGRELTIEQLLHEQDKGITNYVYTLNETTHKIEPKPIRKVFYTKTVNRLAVVTLDNGCKIRCTPEHRFMLRDGTYQEIQNIQTGQTLMPLYRKVSNNGLNGYRLYYEPFEQKWHYEHRSFCCTPNFPKSVVHHKNFKKLDNTPGNLERMLTTDHITLHNREQSEEERIKRSNTVKRWHKDNKNTEQYQVRAKRTSVSLLEHYDSCGKQNCKHRQYKEHHLQLVQIIKDVFGKDFNTLSLAEKNSYTNKASYLLNPKRKQQLTEAAKKSYEGKKEKFTAKGRKWFTNGVDCLYLLPTDTIPEGFYPGRPKRTYMNHKVVSVEIIDCVENVYDIEVVDNHNFALTSGVFVHNSKDGSDSLAGAIWNASLYKDEYVMDLELVNVTADINDETDMSSKFKQQFSNALQSDITKRAENQLDRLFKNYDDDNVLAW